MTEQCFNVSPLYRQMKAAGGGHEHEVVSPGRTHAAAHGGLVRHANDTRGRAEEDDAVHRMAMRAKR